MAASPAYNLSMLFERTANWDFGEVTMTHRMLRILALTDGKTSIAEICQTLDLTYDALFADLQKLHDDWTGANRDIIETRNGALVASSMMMRHEPGHHTIVTYTSKTNGFSWVRSNVIDLGGVGHHAGVTEATIEQLDDVRVQTQQGMVPISNFVTRTAQPRTGSSSSRHGMVPL